ncbi:MAG: hypothetical protein AB7N71_06460 [Phycisphaerae bacterium]
MIRFRCRSVFRAFAVAAALLFQILPAGCINPPASTLVEQVDGFSGDIDFATDKTSTFELIGNEAHLGEYTARGEVTFRENGPDGSLVGDGVAVFTDADNDQLVAMVYWPLQAERSNQREGNIEFRWLDTVTFADGEVFESTGKFADAELRPPGLVVIAIIAVLIGRLCPAVICRGVPN